MTCSMMTVVVVAVFEYPISFFIDIVQRIFLKLFEVEKMKSKLIEILKCQPIIYTYLKSSCGELSNDMHLIRLFSHTEFFDILGILDI